MVKAKCFWCLKKYEQKRFKAKKGVLKGYTIVNLYCSPMCKRFSKKYLEVINELEDLEEIKKKMRGRRKK